MMTGRGGYRLPAVALGFVVLCPGSDRAAAQGLALETELLASGLARPTVVTHAGDGSERLFLAEQTGAIRIWRDGQLLAQPFLELGAKVSCCGEKGLLGLAFHPEYESNGFFYVAYTEVTPNAAGFFDLSWRATRRRPGPTPPTQTAS